MRPWESDFVGRYEHATIESAAPVVAAPEKRRYQMVMRASLLKFSTVEKLEADTAKHRRDLKHP